MLLFIGVSMGAISLLRSQGEAFRGVVVGAFDAATTTSRLSLTIAGVHSDIIRHVALLGTQQNTESLGELRQSLAARLDRAEASRAKAGKLELRPAPLALMPFLHWHRRHRARAGRAEAARLRLQRRAFRAPTCRRCSSPS